MSEATQSDETAARGDGRPPGRGRRAEGRARASRIAREATPRAPLLPAPRGVLVLDADAARRVSVVGLALEWSRRGLVSLRFLRPHAMDAALREATADVPDEVRGPLTEYFAGAPVDPTALPVDLTGTAFQRRVWSALRAIPRGQVRSYGDVAHAVGSPLAVRAVGSANAANPVPLVVPCHRVVHTGGGLGGYSGGGPDRKRRLLVLEGLSVRRGRVDPAQLPLPGG